jgi:hypothetical protein
MNVSKEELLDFFKFGGFRAVRIYYHFIFGMNQRNLKNSIFQRSIHQYTTRLTIGITVYAERRPEMKKDESIIELTLEGFATWK